MKMQTITGRGRPMDVSTASVKFAPWNPRPEITDEDVAELAQSIKDNGLLNRISVIADGDDGYIAFAGNRRLAACRLLKMEDIPVELFDIDEDRARVLTVLENLQRKDVEPIREADLISELIDRGLNGEEIAAQTGRSEAWVSRRRRLSALIPEVRDIVLKNASAITADAMEHMSAYPAEIQRTVFKMRKRTFGEESARISWRDISWDFEHEMRDLDTAVWIKNPCGKCKKNCATCANRTGARPDLFEKVAKDSLGKCLDKECYETQRQQWIKRVVKERTGKDEFTYSNQAYNIPNGASDERTEEFDHVYVAFNWSNEIVIKWYVSPEDVSDRVKADEEKRMAERQAEDGHRAKIRELIGRIETFCGFDEDQQGFDDCEPQALAKSILRDDVPESVMLWIVEKITDETGDLWNAEDTVKLLDMFPAIASHYAPDELQMLRDEVKE